MTVLDWSAYQAKYAYPSPAMMDYDRVLQLYLEGEIYGVVLRYARGIWPDVRLPEFHPALTERGIPIAAYGVFNPYQNVGDQVAVFNATRAEYPIGPGIGKVKIAGDVEIQLPGMSQLVYASLTYQYLSGIDAETVYSSEYLWELLIGSHAAGWQDEFHKWPANYENPNGPRLPDGWDDWTLWQYSETGDGAYYGVGSIHVDENRWNPVYQPPDPDPPPEPGDTLFVVRCIREVSLRSAPSVSNDTYLGKIKEGTIAGVKAIKQSGPRDTDTWIQFEDDGNWSAFIYYDNTTVFFEVIA